jgi:hypothetical protein
MLSSLLTTLNSLRDFFSRAFLIAAFLPTLLFLFVNTLIFYSWSWFVHKWLTKLLFESTAAEQAVMFAVLFFAVWVVSYLVAALTPLWIRTMEGKNWWSWLRTAGEKYHLERYSELSQKINEAVEIYVSIDRDRSQWDVDINNAITAARAGLSGHPPSPNTQSLFEEQSRDRTAHKLIRFDKLQNLIDTCVQEIRSAGYTDNLQRLVSDISQLRDYASDRAKSEHSRLLNERHLNYGEEEEVAPTKFGNVGLVAQAYAMRAYQCNLALIWGALRRAAEKDEKTAKAFENCKSQLDFFVACFWLSLGLAVEWAVLFAWFGDWIPALIASAAGPLLCWMLWYGAAVEQYRVLQDLIVSSLSAFRFQVLTDLRLRLPADLTEERELWRSIDFGIGSGEPLNLRYWHPNS